jgi:hypothetical protein
MQEPITSYIGLDIHKDSVAIAIAPAGRGAPQFVGTTKANLAQVCKGVDAPEVRPEQNCGGVRSGPVRLWLGAASEHPRLALRGDFARWRVSPAPGT